MLSIFITIAGLVTMLFLPIAQYPSIVPPTIDITTTFPGASADTIARTVATPIEHAVNGVESMDYVTSQSTSDGALSLTVSKTADGYSAFGSRGSATASVSDAAR